MIERISDAPHVCYVSVLTVTKRNATANLFKRPITDERIKVDAKTVCILHAQTHDARHASHVVKSHADEKTAVKTEAVEDKCLIKDERCFNV